MTFGSIATSTGIAIGNTLEGVVTASLIARWCTRDEPFRTPTRVVVYSGVAFAPGTVISATVGVGSLALAGYTDPSKFGDIWFTWWLGNVGGQLVVAPIIVLWANAKVFSFDRDETLRMAWLMVATIAVGLVAFSPLMDQTPRRGVFAFLAIGPLLWAALRYSQRETATVALVLSSFAIWGTLSNNGPFVGVSLNDSFLLLLMFVISTAVPSLVLSADVSVRRQAEVTDQRLAAIVDSSHDAIVSKDLNGLITTWNRGAERLFGYTSGVMIGSPITTLIPLDRQHEEVQILERIRRGKPVDPYETVRKRGDASLVDVSVSVSPILNAAGEVIGASDILRDITERKQAELILAERNAQLALAGQAALVGSYAYESDLERMTVSEGYAAMHGLPEGTTETTRSQWRARVHPDLLSACRTPNLA